VCDIYANDNNINKVMQKFVVW